MHNWLWFLLTIITTRACTPPPEEILAEVPGSVKSSTCVQNEALYINLFKLHPTCVSIASEENCNPSQFVCSFSQPATVAQLLSQSLEEEDLIHPDCPDKACLDVLCDAGFSCTQGSCHSFPETTAASSDSTEVDSQASHTSSPQNETESLPSTTAKSEDYYYEETEELYYEEEEEEKESVREEVAESLQPLSSSGPFSLVGNGTCEGKSQAGLKYYRCKDGSCVDFPTCKAVCLNDRSCIGVSFGLDSCFIFVAVATKVEELDPSNLPRVPWFENHQCEDATCGDSVEGASQDPGLECYRRQASFTESNYNEEVSWGGGLWRMVLYFFMLSVLGLSCYFLYKRLVGGREEGTTHISSSLDNNSNSGGHYEELGQGKGDYDDNNPFSYMQVSMAELSASGTPLSSNRDENNPFSYDDELEDDDL